MKQKCRINCGDRIESPPTRGRGLKQDNRIHDLSHKVSPPTRGRGLKQEKPKILVPGVRRPPRGGVD